MADETISKRLPTDSLLDSTASISPLDTAGFAENAPAKPKTRRIRYPHAPVVVDGIQYNTCKNPECEQFGVPPPETDSWNEDSPYALGDNAKSSPVLTCKSCFEASALKSNAGIAEEIGRISDYLVPALEKLSCPDAACSNHSVPVGTAKAYWAFGKTKQGAKRFRCIKCRKTFSLAVPTRYQRDTSVNKDLFKLLVRKAPLSSIVSILGIQWHTLYRRIDFIHKRCMSFIGNRERRLATLPIRRLYLAIDRQDHLVNWTERQDKRNIVLTAIASADNETGYIFGSHANFDYQLDREAVEQAAEEAQDAIAASPYSKYARLWTKADYAKSVSKSNKKNSYQGNPVSQQIRENYGRLDSRADEDVFDEKRSDEKLPNYGMQTHSEYTMIAHFYHLRRLVGNCEKWRFFLDQETGIRNALLTVFQPEVANRTAEAFYVSIQKDMTVDDKRRRLQEVQDQFKKLSANYPGLSETEIKLELIKASMRNVQVIGRWQDRWIEHPLPSMSEPHKAVCWLTEHDDGDMDETHKAWLYNKASLHAVDSYFMKTRRRIHMCERPIRTSSNTGRIWSAYQAYNPAVLVKLLEIFRVVHNYIDTPKKGEKTTPAMRLGLAEAVLDYGDVLYFKV